MDCELLLPANLPAAAESQLLAWTSASGRDMSPSAVVSTAVLQASLNF
jgi:hypothetical protein